MECRFCKIIKLPNEFSPENVTENCDHPTLFCLRCIIKAANETSKCIHPGCNQPAKPTDRKIIWFQAILDDMFKEYNVDDDDDSDQLPTTVFAGSILTVTVLTGESMSVPYQPDMEILQLKQKIRSDHRMGHEVGKQKLLYNDKELTDYNNDGRRARLSDFGVRPNASIYLVVLLFSVPEHFDHVVFDLYWGYPSSGKDYLDASCLMFNGLKFVCLSDYDARNPVRAVRHSGDVMNRRRKKGHHTIEVKLQQLPRDITHLFFTLSAWDSPNISRYPNPSLKFYEAANPTQDLCKTTFSHARYSQAVIMCVLSRGPHGRWEIFESGKVSSGNARNYGPIKSTIRSLISQGF